MIFQQVILAEYEKLVGKEEPVPSLRSASERLRSLEQLKGVLEQLQPFADQLRGDIAEPREVPRRMREAVD
jgi:hypothetical protein